MHAWLNEIFKAKKDLIKDLIHACDHKSHKAFTFMLKNLITCSDLKGQTPQRLNSSTNPKRDQKQENQDIKRSKHSKAKV